MWLLKGDDFSRRACEGLTCCAGGGEIKWRLSGTSSKQFRSFGPQRMLEFADCDWEMCMRE